MSNLTFKRLGKSLVLGLDRPEALNSLNYEMVRGLKDSLLSALADPDVFSILIHGEGGKAFCAGGDIKAARLGAMAIRDGRMSVEQVVAFFVEEYDLNKYMFHYSKPLVAFMNGITMGGGVGVAGPCTIRIATEKIRWAMPEVSIGFFPDVGAAYYLGKAPHYAGRYLALTGASLTNADDLIYCGLATHFANTEYFGEIEAALSEAGEVTAALDDFKRKAVPGDLPYSIIEACFQAPDVEQILTNLKAEGSAWATETKDLIESKSPTSLKVALKHVMMAEHENFDEVIARDLCLAHHFMQSEDLIEGVRAVVVDKDRKPKWNPARLQDVGDDEVIRLFNKNLGCVG